MRFSKTLQALNLVMFLTPDHDNLDVEEHGASAAFVYGGKRGLFLPTSVLPRGRGNLSFGRHFHFLGSRK